MLVLYNGFIRSFYFDRLINPSSMNSKQRKNNKLIIIKQVELKIEHQLLLIGIYNTCTLNHILEICTWGMGKNNPDSGYSNSHKRQLRREGECLYHCT